mgnify:CR=1 FL=1
MGNRVALHNLGCKVNAYEIEAMQQLLEEAGYEIVPFEPGADIYVINTCTVTNIADRKSRQMLHKAKKIRSLTAQTPQKAKYLCSLFAWFGPPVILWQQNVVQVCPVHSHSGFHGLVQLYGRPQRPVPG